MDPLSQAQLTTLRDLLTYRLRELRAEVYAAEQAQRQPVAAGLHDVADRKDEVAQRQALQPVGAQEQRDVDEMSDVESALDRLDAGTYCDCADCAEPIPLERLLVQPAAKRCAACQAAHEHARRRATTH